MSNTETLTDPASAAEEVIPGQPLAFISRGLYLGRGGDVRLMLADGHVVTLRNMSEGIVYPLRVRQVFEDGTTAGDIVALR